MAREQTDYYMLKLIMSLPNSLRKSFFKEGTIKVRGSEIDPHVRTMLTLQEKQGRMALDEIGREQGVEAAREAYRYFYKIGAWPGRKAQVQTQDLLLPGGAGQIEGRLYTPNKLQSDGLLVYIHGGGGVIGDTISYDYFNRYLAEKLGTVVLFLDYRLGPEHKYPAGVEDCIAVTKALPELSAQFGTNAKNIIIGGDSAGGMLATICGHEGVLEGVDIKALWLLFAALDFANAYPSLDDYGVGFGLSRSMMEWFGDQYFEEGEDRAAPFASPINLPHLERLPKILLRVAEYDPIADHSTAFMDRAKPLGVDITYRLAKGLLHGYTNLFSVLPAAKAALDEDLTWLQAEFTKA